VFLITLIASVIPDLTFLSNIGGSISGVLIGLVFPPLMYNKQYGNELSSFKRGFNYGLIVFGVLGGAYSMYVSFSTLSQDN